MSTAILLLLGLVSDEDYWRIQDARRRGLRYQVARPGWSNRWGAVVRTILYVLLMLAFAMLVVLTASAVGQ
jgi:hypothetical protein